MSYHLFNVIDTKITVIKFTALFSPCDVIFVLFIGFVGRKLINLFVRQAAYAKSGPLVLVRRLDAM